jgi:hypothetical protein
VKHLQKLLIKAVMICNLKESMQTLTAFGSFKVRRLKRRHFNEKFLQGGPDVSRGQFFQKAPPLAKLISG